MHAVTLIVHFVAAILGLGQVAAIVAILATPISDRKLLSRLVTFVSWSVPVVFITGIALVQMANDHPEHHWWMRLVMLTTIYLGYLAGTSRLVLRKSADPVPADALTRLRGKAWSMTAATAVVIVLISAKPG